MKKPLLFLTLSGFALLVIILLLTLPARPEAEPVAEETPARTATQPQVQAAAETPSPKIRHTPSPTVTLAPNQLGTRVTFTAEDGRELVGYFYPAWKPNAPIVVLMHEYGNSQAAWNESAIIPWMQNWGAQDALGTGIYLRGRQAPSNAEGFVVRGADV